MECARLVREACAWESIENKKTPGDVNGPGRRFILVAERGQVTISTVISKVKNEFKN